MTTERKYLCDLCRDQIDPNSPKKYDSNLIRDASIPLSVYGHGIHFEGSHQGVPFKFVSISEAEHHICWACISSVRKNSA